MDLGCVNVVRDFDSTSKEEINVLHIWIGTLSNADAWKFGLWLFVRPCLVPLCSAVTLYISHQMLTLEAKSGASVHQSLSEMIVALLWCLYLSFRSHGVDEWGGRGALKSDKLLKIAFKQSFLFGHTWHIWLWSGNKSAVAEGSAHRVVPHITPSSSSSSTSSLLVWSANIEVHLPPPPSVSVGC